MVEMLVLIITLSHIIFPQNTEVQHWLLANVTITVFFLFSF